MSACTLASDTGIRAICPSPPASIANLGVTVTLSLPVTV